jgi:glutamate dehydrogenase
VLAGARVGASANALVAEWQHEGGRALERAAQLLGELRAVQSPDSAMLSVTLRELRALG